MPPTTVSHRKQPCNGCRSRKKRCDTTRPSCSNCRKWGILCDYTNRAHAADRIFGISLTGERSDANTLTGALEWNIGLSTNVASAESLSAQYSISTASGTWPTDANTGQNSLLASNLFQRLDPNNPADTFPELSMVTPESITNATDLTGIDFTGLLENGDHLSAPESRNTISTRKSWSTSIEDVDKASHSSRDILPVDSLLQELMNIYFDQHHVCLPFLHKARYLQSVKHLNRDNPDRQAAALLYAVIAIAAVSHPDSAVRSRQKEWFAKAKQLCEDGRERKYPSLQGIQASLCIVILAWTTGDYPLSWLYIGTSWRQACTLGLNRIDGEKIRFLEKEARPRCSVEVEERRRTIWMLFMMDRGMAFPAGWPHAIDDRQFMVNLPIEDSVFQDAHDKTPALKSSMPFSRNLRKTIMATPEDGKATVHHAIMKAYLLLGRVNEHVHSLEASSDPDEHLREFRQLDTELCRFKLSLPRHATILRISSAEEAKHVVWLNAILSTVTILLHHRPVTAEDELPQSPSTERSTASQPDNNVSFEYCVSAARNMARLIQEATRISIDALINPHIGSSLYVCGKILILHTHLTKSDEVRTDIDMLLLLFDRIADIYPTLGTKFKNGTRYDLQQDVEGIRKMRKDGASGMMTKCSDWAGANPQATLEKLTAAFGR